ncbi:MAG: putative toxin-antitoxin system toxin component, PIN family [Candidatus Micrarchaeales archaeon]
MMRIVLDTNILISGLLYIGKPKKLIDLALNGKIQIVSSADIIDEFKGVVSREKFKLEREEQAQLVSFVVRISHIVSLKGKFRVVKEDPDDDMVIGTAYDGKASYIVSGDKHLLKIKEFAGIKIVTANQMLNLIGA